MQFGPAIDYDVAAFALCEITYGRYGVCQRLIGLLRVFQSAHVAVTDQVTLL
jgi:hypothetical protein